VIDISRRSWLWVFFSFYSCLYWLFFCHFL